MKKLEALLLVPVLAAAGCSLPVLEAVPECGYAARTSEAEFVFVLPTIEEYAAGGTDIYAAPRRAARLFVSSFAYSRELAGKKYKRLGEVDGEDGRYEQWLLEDCRLFYTRAAEGK